MTDASPEIMARIRLYSRAESTPKIMPLFRPLYECPLYYNEQYYDCQIILDDDKQPGTSFEASVKFMQPWGIVPRLRPGDTFSLWEKGMIGDGRVVAIIDRSPVHEHIRQVFSQQDLKTYDRLCARFAELSACKNNEMLWEELGGNGEMTAVLDDIHSLRQQYNVTVAGMPFFSLWVFDPEEPRDKKGCQKRKLEKSWG